MPAKNPRLTITLQPSLAAQLRRISELTGNSQSGLIGELLEGSEPVFDRLIQVLEAAQTAKQSMRGKLTEEMDAAQSKIEGAMGIALESFDQLSGSLIDASETVTRRARRGPATRGVTEPVAAEPTPISNRGVRYDPKATKSIAQSRVSVRPKAEKTGAKIRGGK